MLLALTFAAVLCAAPDVGDAGFVVDYPAAGAALTGQWTAVSGRLDPTQVQFLAISGAPRDGFYAPTGGTKRLQKLPFAVTAAAVDVRPSIEGTRGGDYGPVHVYVAGKGVLQRRVFDRISPGG